jgi:hypothetical protein
MVPPARPVLTSAPNEASRDDGDAVDAEYAAEQVKVAVVVQDGVSAFGGGGD